MITALIHCSASAVVYEPLNSALKNWSLESQDEDAWTGFLLRHLGSSFFFTLEVSPLVATSFSFLFLKQLFAVSSMLVLLFCSSLLFS